MHIREIKYFQNIEKREDKMPEIGRSLFHQGTIIRPVMRLTRMYRPVLGTKIAHIRVASIHGRQGKCTPYFFPVLVVESHMVCKPFKFQ